MKFYVNLTTNDLESLVRKHLKEEHDKVFGEFELPDELNVDVTAMVTKAFKILNDVAENNKISTPTSYQKPEINIEELLSEIKSQIPTIVDEQLEKKTDYLTKSWQQNQENTIRENVKIHSILEVLEIGNATWDEIIDLSGKVDKEDHYLINKLVEKGLVTLKDGKYSKSLNTYMNKTQTEVSPKGTDKKQVETTPVQKKSENVVSQPVNQTKKTNTGKRNDTAIIRQKVSEIVSDGKWHKKSDLMEQVIELKRSGNPSTHFGEMKCLGMIVEKGSGKEKKYRVNETGLPPQNMMDEVERVLRKLNKPVKFNDLVKHSPKGKNYLRPTVKRMHELGKIKYNDKHYHI